VARKTKVPGRKKINEGTAELLLQIIARMWPQIRNLQMQGFKRDARREKESKV
jgi:hypothetical protein